MFTSRLSSSRRAIAAIAAIAVLVALVASCSSGESGGAEKAAAASGPNPVQRDLDPYRGLGTWVDVFDYHPAFQSPGARPAVSPQSVADMASLGVRTLYLQAAREDARTPGEIAHPTLVREFLQQAHRHDVRVVAWYLPKHADLGADMRHIEALLDYEVEGLDGIDRFDGVALDIEDTTTVADYAERNTRLIDLSQRAARAAKSAGDVPLGAIVLPPVALEVVNQELWPSFPWDDIAPYYEVWMPMGYWSLRRESSGYHDGYTYTDENIRRMLANIGDSKVPVHPIGGIGDIATPDEYSEFVRAAKEHNAIGWSIYDWVTTSSAAWPHLG